MSNTKWTILYLDRHTRCAFGNAEDAVLWAHLNSKKRVKVRILSRLTMKSLYDPGLSRIEPELANWQAIGKTVVSMKFRSINDAVIFKMHFGELIVAPENVRMSATLPGGQSLQYYASKIERMTCSPQPISA